MSCPHILICLSSNKTSFTKDTQSAWLFSTELCLELTCLKKKARFCFVVYFLNLVMNPHNDPGLQISRPSLIDKVLWDFCEVKQFDPPEHSEVKSQAQGLQNRPQAKVRASNNICCSCTVWTCVCLRTRNIWSCVERHDCRVTACI